MHIVIADDHPLYREAMGMRLLRQHDTAKITEAGTLGELMAIAGSGEASVDLILLDLRMPGMEGGRSVSSVVKAFPDAAVVLVSGAAGFEDVRRAIAAGARGFLPKTLSSKDFASAISMILAGGSYLPAETLQLHDFNKNGQQQDDLQPGELQLRDLQLNGGPPRPEAQRLASELTTRQQQVLVQVAAGATNKEIGRNLDIAEVTVKLHVRQVFRKINARNRAEAASIAARAGLI